MGVLSNSVSSGLWEMGVLSRSLCIMGKKGGVIQACR